MDKLLPSPPATTDPITYIAFAVVTALIAVLIWQLRVAAEERASEKESREEALKAFRDELAAQRSHDEKSIAEIRNDHRESVDQIHRRLDGVQTEVTKIAARPACPRPAA